MFAMVCLLSLIVRQATVLGLVNAISYKVQILGHSFYPLFGAHDSLTESSMCVNAMCRPIICLQMAPSHAIY